MKTLKKLLKEIEPYCNKITFNKGHYKAYIKDTDKVITISGTSSDMNFIHNVKRDFRRLGIDL